MTDWRIIDTGLGDPAWNMAVDEAIRDGVIRGDSPPTVRFYDWAPPTLSIGYHQEMDKETDLTLLAEHGFGFVRRPTGGRAVLHRHEVTYAVIAPIDGLVGGSVNESYAAISEALAAGLRALGVNAVLQRGSLSAASQREAANPCFSSTSRFELSVEGRKIVGSAQVRKDGVLLQHGSIMLTHDQSMIAWLAPGYDDDKRRRIEAYMKRKSVCIDEAAGRRVDYAEAVAAFAQGFIETWPEMSFRSEQTLLSHERLEAEKLRDDKYATDDWNMRK